MGRADSNHFLNLAEILGSTPELLYQDLNWLKNSVFSKEKPSWLGPHGLALDNNCLSS